MELDDIVQPWQSVPQRWLYRCSDRSPFAYARGSKLIRYRDHTPWALQHESRLVSLRSSAELACRVGDVYYDATSHEAVYYVPLSVALPEHPPCGESGAVRATHDASPRRTARAVTRGNETPIDQLWNAPTDADAGSEGACLMSSGPIPTAR